MGSTVRIQMNSAGAVALLIGKGVLGALMAKGEEIASRANAQSSFDPMYNAPYTAVDDSTPKRARVRVLASQPHGQRAPEERLMNNLR